MRRGLSFIEVMVTLFILALCLLPVYDLIERSGRSAKMTRDEIMAGQFALELINQIRGMPFQHIPILDALALPNGENGRLLRMTVPASRVLLSVMPDGFIRSLTVERVGDYLKKVTVEISWKLLLTHSRKYITFLAWNP